MSDDELLRERITQQLARRGLLAADGKTTVFGKPAVRLVSNGAAGSGSVTRLGDDEGRSGDGPQRLDDATPPQRRLVGFAYATPWTGSNSCAQWVEQVFSRMGFGVVCGDAYQLCRNYCSRTNPSQLEVGMIVGVEHHPFGANGLTYGHVGIYVGDCQVRDCSDAGLRTSPLDAWLSVYGAMDDPRWGWLGGIALDQAQRTW